MEMLINIHSDNVQAHVAGTHPNPACTKRSDYNEIVINQYV